MKQLLPKFAERRLRWETLYDTIRDVQFSLCIAANVPVFQQPTTLSWISTQPGKALFQKLMIPPSENLATKRFQDFMLEDNTKIPIIALLSRQQMLIVTVLTTKVIILITKKSCVHISVFFLDSELKTQSIPSCYRKSQRKNIEWETWSLLLQTKECRDSESSFLVCFF